MSDTNYLHLRDKVNRLESDMGHVTAVTTEMRSDMRAYFDLLNSLDKKMSRLCEAAKAREREGNKQRSNLTNYISMFAAIVAALGVIYMMTK